MHEYSVSHKGLFDSFTNPNPNPNPNPKPNPNPFVLEIITQHTSVIRHIKLKYGYILYCLSQTTVYTVYVQFKCLGLLFVSEDRHQLENFNDDNSM